MNYRAPCDPSIRRKTGAALFGVLLVAGVGGWGDQPPTEETVIVIHGIVNRPFVMGPLQKRPLVKVEL